LRIDVPLTGIPEESSDDDRDVDEEELANPTHEAKAFLKSHPMAKIVVVIDTHCLENGAFVYKGDSPVTYEACSLLEVGVVRYPTFAPADAPPQILQGCIPREVFRFLSDASGTPPHRHRSLVINLACGASVSQEAARHRLLQGCVQEVNSCRDSTNPLALRHCADAVVSLANDVTLVSEVASNLAEFITRWIQSASDIDTIVGSTFPAKWARDHQPVVSTRDCGHTLYTKFDVKEPNGQLVLCHRMCGSEMRAKPGKENVRFTCYKCMSRCSVPRLEPDLRTYLGRRDLIRTAYPQAQFPTEWELPKLDQTSAKTSIAKDNEASASRMDKISPPKVDKISPPKVDKTSPPMIDKTLPLKSSKTDPPKSDETSKTSGADRKSKTEKAALPTDTMPEGIVYLFPPNVISRTVSQPPSASSSLTIRVPARLPKHEISRSQSTSRLDDRPSGAVAMPPPPQPVRPRKRLTSREIEPPKHKQHKKK